MPCPSAISPLSMIPEPFAPEHAVSLGSSRRVPISRVMAGDPGPRCEGRGSSAREPPPAARHPDCAWTGSCSGAQWSLYSGALQSGPFRGPRLASPRSWACGHIRAVQFHLNQQHAGCRSQPCGFGDHQCQLHKMPVARAILPSHSPTEEKKVVPQVN